MYKMIDEPWSQIGSPETFQIVAEQREMIQSVLIGGETAEFQNSWHHRSAFSARTDRRDAMQLHKISSRHDFFGQIEVFYVRLFDTHHDFPC
jgi:hypothetical protein